MTRNAPAVLCLDAQQRPTLDRVGRFCLARDELPRLAGISMTGATRIKCDE